MLWEVLVLLLIVWLVQRRWVLRRQISLMNKMKSNIKCYPIIGHGYLFIDSIEDRMNAIEAFAREAIGAGGVAPMWVNQLFIWVADPVICETLMNQCLEKDGIGGIVINFLIGNGSFNAPVPIWRPRRKIIVPTMSMKNLNRFAEVFSKRSIAMAHSLEKEVGKGVFSFWNYIADCNLDKVCENILGINLDATNDIEKHAFHEAIDEFCRFAANRLCKPWFHSDFMVKFMPEYGAAVKSRDTIRNFIAKIINEKKKLIEKNKAICTPNAKNTGNVTSFLDLQLESEDNKRLTDYELLEEAIVLIIAALDTSATAAGFTMLMLAKYPDIQEKVYEELQEVFGDSDRPVTSKDLPHLKYLESVIKEALRLFPPGPIISRKVDKDITLPSGLTIVKDTGLVINIMAIHRHPAYWGEDAEQFRPERFLDYKPKHPAAFLPFSYGLRNCIGYQYAMMSLKIVLATVLRRFRVLPPPGVTKEDPVRTTCAIMLKHVDNFKIQLEKRK